MGLAGKRHHDYVDVDGAADDRDNDADDDEHHGTKCSRCVTWQIRPPPEQNKHFHCRGVAKPEIFIPTLGESAKQVTFPPSVGSTFLNIAPPLQREGQLKNGRLTVEVWQKLKNRAPR